MRLHRIGTALLLALGLVFTGQSAVSAEPPVNLQQVRQQIDDLHDQAEAATERFNALTDQIASLKVQLAAAQARVEQHKQAVANARQALGRVAADTYKEGDLSTLNLLLGDDPDRILAANGLLVSLGDRRAEAVDTLRRQQQGLVADMTEIQEQQQRLEQALAELRTTRTEIVRKLAEANAVLARLTAAQRGQLGQLRAGEDRHSLADLGITVPANGRLSCDGAAITFPSGRVGKVLAFACSQIGKPYGWGQTGPSRYDCSGLTLSAWRQGGVSLPRTAASQAGAGTRVSKSQIQPGDLLFYRSPPTHVAIYIGNGLMLHAPQTGDVVKIVPMRANPSSIVRY